PGQPHVGGEPHGEHAVDPAIAVVDRDRRHPLALQDQVAGAGGPHALEDPQLIVAGTGGRAARAALLLHGLDHGPPSPLASRTVHFRHWPVALCTFSDASAPPAPVILTVMQPPWKDDLVVKTP